MKTVIVLIFSAFLLFSCQNRESPSPDALDRDASYAFGMFIAAQTGLEDLSFDYNALMEGFRDFNEGRDTRFSMDEAFDLIIPAIMVLQAEMDERMWLEGERNREDGEAYMAQNQMRHGVNVTSSGLQWEVIVQGTGPRPGPTDSVVVHYEGSYVDGTAFDSSYWWGEPFEFELNPADPMDSVIPGWIEGIQLMNEGSTFRFVIPSNLAYGSGGGSIPPHSTLIFEVELLYIVR
ncbi:MAG: FKBP-type peptidyl-prolyl cis-trans isomerase [Treponema sp.]|nr:FKBP-type peptidyl-prolyl cis-trans isomerase [Treponema sp.]